MEPAPDRPNTDNGQEYACLLGLTSLSEYLDYVAAEAIVSEDPKDLAEQWRRATDRRAQLERDEEHWTNQLPATAKKPPELQPLSPEMTERVPQVLADPVFQRAFAIVRTRIAMAPLDELVVYQRSVNLDHVHVLEQRLGANPSPEELFRFCLPTERELPPYRVRPIKKDSFVFISDSTDLRFLEPVVLAGDQIVDYQPFGPVAGVVGLVVGYGSNFLNVISAEGRLILNNGNHRAYALRHLGITHAPCLIQDVARRDELEAVAGGRLSRDPDAYLKHPRPPYLSDFFDPTLSRKFRLIRKSRHVRVTFKVEEISI